MLIQRFLNSLPRNLPDSPVILDVGSYHGEQACEFAKVFPQARIFAFEARPMSAELVRRNVAKFPNIEVIEAAIHEFDGESEFHAVDEMNPGASSLSIGSGVQEIHPIKQHSIAVAALRLDTWAKRASANRFDLVWMDLQGAELPAIRGMGDLLHTLQAMQLEITYRELYREQAMWPEVQSNLERSGMRLADEWPDVCGYFGDAIFVR